MGNTKENYNLPGDYQTQIRRLTIPRQNGIIIRTDGKGAAKAQRMFSLRLFVCAGVRMEYDSYAVRTPRGEYEAKPASCSISTENIAL
ncbi:MAG: hypothetical protein LUC83_01830 [Clostridiales bacterium]|nr:hypothetical protein [Clostridiales bacterium]